MKSIRSRFVLALGLFAWGLPSVGEDIDLFVRANPSSDAPNVLIVLDNAAGFSASSTVRCQINGVYTALDKTVGGIEQCAMYEVIESLPADSVRIGIMVYKANGVRNFQGVPCTGDSNAYAGGCLAYPIALMTESNKTALLSWIRNWKTSGSGDGYIKSNGQATGAAMQEAWAYISGRTGISGTDYSSIKPTACNTYVLFIGNAAGPNGSPGDQTGAKGPRGALEGGSSTPSGMRASPPASAEQRAQIIKTTTNACGTFTFPTGNNHETKGYYADEWARYMYAQDITTYTIGFLDSSCKPEYPATLESMAFVGNGKYFPTRDRDEFKAAFQTALSEMLSVNSVFASVSLPVSVNTEGTYLNQVYIGMFRPDRDTQPRWMGNLKQYRLGRVPPAVNGSGGGPIKLVDARDPYQEAISSAGTGFVGACALSYWTPPPADEDTYWSLFVERNCGTADARSNTPDGPIVEKGGQGYTLRGTPVSERNLKTCSNSTCGSETLADFSDANSSVITKTRLGNASMSDEERTLLVNWARGVNNRGSAAGRAIDADETADEAFVAATSMRPSVHADVVHSRPVALNFAASDDDPPEVVVFYGGNDGVLRAINGNREDPIGDAMAGEEMWGFMAPEFFGNIKRLRDNSPTIMIKGRETETWRRPKPYGFDGVITAYEDRASNHRWIFASMRRGGRMVYAFDVSDITDDPESPELLWRLGCNEDGCTTGIDVDEIGQTWSAPKLLKSGRYPDWTGTRPDDYAAQPMLVMGGGYDNCEDTDYPNSCNASAKGRRIYVLNAETGTVLKALPTERPVVADVFVVPDKTTGWAKWAYVVDMGGNVYRLSGSPANTPLTDTAPGSWTLTKIASLGCDDTSACSPNRKFMFAPDVVEDSGGYVLLVGSGDREKPLRDYAPAFGVENYFFMFRDVPTDDTWLDAEVSTCGAELICLGSLLGITGSSNPDPDQLAAKKGWYLGMQEGEQVVTSAITVFGAVTFSTHTPTDPPEGACTSDLGTARVYNIRYANAAPSRPGATSRYAEIDGGGLPPSPVAGKVILDDGEEAYFIIGADPQSSLEGGEPEPPSLTTLPKSITYWYIER